MELQTGGSILLILLGTNPNINDSAFFDYFHGFKLRQ